jgi:hypothetical protein
VVTVQSVLDEPTAQRFHALYEKTFRPMAVLAVARQVLHEHEFMEEMFDSRVDKYLAWDEDGEPIAMCTLTRHLETVPWISPEYFAHNFPEQTARGAVYYLGFILVDQTHRQAHLCFDLVKDISQMLAEEEAMCAFDLCGFNKDVLGLADAVASLIGEITDVDFDVADTQTYYRAIALSKPNVPEMRNSG